MMTTTVRKTPVAGAVHVADWRDMQAVQHEIPGTGVVMRRNQGEPHPLVPRADADYVFRRDIVEEIAFCAENDVRGLLVGPAGSGKSSAVMQIAAQLNVPVRRVNLNGESDTSLFTGREYPVTVEGVRQMVYRWGILPNAMTGPFWLLLDEIDAALQPVLFILQWVLEDGGCLLLDDADSTLVPPMPWTSGGGYGFRIFATSNAVGIAGADRVLYTGTNRMNEATLDRFGCVMHVEYMPEEQELAVIRKVAPEAKGDIFAKAIVKVATEVRKNLEDDKLSCTFSTRRCLQWARAMHRFHPLRAAELAILNKLSREDAEVLRGIIQRYFGT